MPFTATDEQHCTMTASQANCGYVTPPHQNTLTAERLEALQRAPLKRRRRSRSTHRRLRRRHSFERPPRRARRVRRRLTFHQEEEEEEEVMMDTNHESFAMTHNHVLQSADVASVDTKGGCPWQRLHLDWMSGPRIMDVCFIGGDTGQLEGSHWERSDDKDDSDRMEDNHHQERMEVTLDSDYDDEENKNSDESEGCRQCSTSTTLLPLVLSEEIAEEKRESDNNNNGTHGKGGKLR